MDSHTSTFTKWLVGEGPEMVGVAGGAVGEGGTYSGRVLELEAGDPTTVVRAVYRLAGPEHDFTVLMFVEQTGLKATLAGVVTDGWHKGDFVRGQYNEIQYEHDGTTTDAWQGTVAFLGSSAKTEVTVLAEV